MSILMVITICSYPTVACRPAGLLTTSTSAATRCACSAQRIPTDRMSILKTILQFILVTPGTSVLVRLRVARISSDATATGAIRQQESCLSVRRGITQSLQPMTIEPILYIIPVSRIWVNFTKCVFIRCSRMKTSGLWLHLLNIQVRR